ncbi:MAG: protocatechuate 3,4-dioxygenase, alpha subunit [Thermomicrobiales bacterium]|jgi:protocatechuate 3,4-dioxygenase alpha subunit|nr:protocatechuate 3,4-dioxygenase, alpha subunit [Thermomicrobiales bacterium]
MTVRGLTSSQTVGPFFHPALLREDCRRNVHVRPGTSGERIRIEGRVYDGEQAPVPDALVEIWQANAFGRYNHPLDQRELPLEPDFTGFGRTGTDDEGRYWFETVKPGTVPFAGGLFQAPHVCYTIFARGLINHLVTRLYFEDEPANKDDPVLQRVPPERRTTLLAKRDVSAGIVVYRFDIVLQGVAETAFFNI